MPREKLWEGQDRTVFYPILGVIKGAFPPDCKIMAVYDWVGSRSTHREHFALCFCPESILYPERDITLVASSLFCIEPQHFPIPLSEMTMSLLSSVLYPKRVLMILWLTTTSQHEQTMLMTVYQKYILCSGTILFTVTVREPLISRFLSLQLCHRMTLSPKAAF